MFHVYFQHYTDCGPPPNVSNAYVSIGPSTVGSERKYSCDEGYDMVGVNRIKCRPIGVWSVPEFSCNGKIYVLLYIADITMRNSNILISIEALDKLINWLRKLSK